MTLRIEATPNDTGIGTHDLDAGICVNITADSGERDGQVYLTVNVTHEGIIADAYNDKGDCIGTIAGDFDDWEDHIVHDPGQKPLWEDDRVQFARLLAEINATHSEIDFAALEESMDVQRDDIDELFERAEAVFEASKARNGWLDSAGR